MHQDTFDANFYIVAATIIPVLFLALTLQGSTYEALLTNWHGIVKKTLELSRARANLYDVLIYLVAGFVPVSGFLGELQAVFALYEGHATNNTKQFIFISIIVLLSATAFIPSFRFAKTMITTKKALYEEEGQDSEHPRHAKHEESDDEPSGDCRSDEDASGSKFEET